MLDYYIDLIPNEQKKNSLLYQPISEIVPFLLPEAEDGKQFKRRS